MSLHNGLFEFLLAIGLTMLIAVEGCCHGELDKIYETIQHAEQQNDIKVDLLLICGDFQAVRNKSDLASMAVPVKYQKLNTFYKFVVLTSCCLLVILLL